MRRKFIPLIAGYIISMSCAVYNLATSNEYVDAKLDRDRAETAASSARDTYESAKEMLEEAPPALTLDDKREQERLLVDARGKAETLTKLLETDLKKTEEFNKVSNHRRVADLVWDLGLAMMLIGPMYVGNKPKNNPNNNPSNGQSNV